MNRGLFCLIILLAFSFGACKRQRTARTDGAGTIGKIKVEEIDYTYFTSKAKIDYNDGKSSLGLTVSIRMKKDSIIWLSASPALGIEAARAVITPDSVKIIDRINNRYQAYSIDYLKNTFNVDLSFANLQNMLMGNLVVPKSLQDEVDEESSAECVVLLQKNGKIDIANFISRSNRKVIKLKVDDIPTGNELVVNYEDFNALGEYLFAYKNLISATVPREGSSNNIQIRIEHNKAEISENPLNFAFNVPKKFESR